MPSSTDYEARLDAFRNHDKEREDLIRDLVKKVDELKESYREKRKAFKEQELACHIATKKQEELEDALREIKGEQARDVSALSE